MEELPVVNYTPKQLGAIVRFWRREYHDLRVCFYCGMKLRRAKPIYCQSSRYRQPVYLRTLEHVIPKSRGGEDDHDNTVYCCQGCNNGKGNMLLEEFRLARYNSDAVEFFFETEIRRRLDAGTMVLAEIEAPIDGFQILES